MSVSSNLTPEEMEAAERVRRIVDEFSAEETAAIAEWAKGRTEGPGVTPGTAASAYKRADELAGALLAGADINPKELAATRDQKPPLHLLEHAADVEIGADASAIRTFVVEAREDLQIAEEVRRLLGDTGPRQ